LVHTNTSQSLTKGTRYENESPEKNHHQTALSLPFKKLQAFAGMSLRISVSGEYSGNRHITHIGKPRLRAVLFKMTEKTKNYVPEVRIRFLKRQMKYKVCFSRKIKTPGPGNLSK